MERIEIRLKTIIKNITMGVIHRNMKKFDITLKVEMMCFYIIHTNCTYR